MAANKTEAVWTTINLTSVEGKALKAKLTQINAEAKAVKADLETMAMAVIAVPKGKKAVFSHRFGLGYSIVDQDDNAKTPAKPKTGPCI